MMVTMKYPEPRGIEANTEFYGFYVRATGETRRLLREARRKFAEQHGAPPSNSVLLKEMVWLYTSPERP